MKELIFIVVISLFIISFDKASSYCPPNYFKCQKIESVKCITKDWVCDKNEDCADGSDEFNCKITSCNDKQFKCRQTNSCIDLSKKCDGEFDCPDQSDELNCTNHDSCNSLNEFNCGDKETPNCIDLKLVCDEKVHCNNKKDEGSMCSQNKCIENNNFKPCSHNCTNKYISYVCHCPEGLVLNDDKRTCSLNGQCYKNFDKCSQNCIESSNTFKCDCYEGFKRRNNLCESNSTKDKIYLFYLYNNTIVQRNLENNIETVFHSNNSFDLLSFASNNIDNQLILYTNMLHVVNIIETLSFPNWLENGLKNKNIETKANFVNGSVLSMTVDQTRNLLFWTDADFHAIRITDLVSQSVVTIINESNCYYPSSIQVDPINTRIYWIDVGSQITKPRIMSSYYDGTDIIPIVTNYIYKPTSLAIDLISRRLYWSDHGPGSINYVDLDNLSHRINILEHNEFKPYSIAVFENKIYWADWNQKKIYSAEKTTGAGMKTILSRNSHKLNQLQVISFAAQQRLKEMVIKNHKDQLNVLCHGESESVCQSGCIPKLNDNVLCFPDEKKEIKHASLVSNSKSKVYWFLLIPIIGTILLLFILFNKVSLSKLRNLKGSCQNSRRNSKTNSPQREVTNHSVVYDHVKFWEQEDDDEDEVKIDGDNLETEEDRQCKISFHAEDTTPIVV